MLFSGDFVSASLSLIQKHHNSPNWIWNEILFTDHGDSKYMHKWNQTSFLKQFVFTLAWNHLLKLENSLNSDSNSIVSAWGLNILMIHQRRSLFCKNETTRGDEVIISLSASGQERSDWVQGRSTWAILGASKWDLQNTIIFNSLHQELVKLVTIITPVHFTDEFWMEFKVIK